MNIRELQEKFPLVYEALAFMGEDDCGVLNPRYEFSDGARMVEILEKSEQALTKLKDHRVADVISKSAIKEQRSGVPWDGRDDEEWEMLARESTLEVAVCSEQAYMDALSATVPGGEVLQSFLNHCFDGDYSYDSNGNRLFVWG